MEFLDIRYVDELVQNFYQYKRPSSYVNMKIDFLSHSTYNYLPQLSITL